MELGRLKPKVVLTHWSPNKRSRGGVKPVFIVIHDTESTNRKGTSDLAAIGDLFANPAIEASAHVATDGDGTSARFVRDSESAWAQGNLNPRSLAVEQIGFASWSTKTWRSNIKLLKETARWIADWSIKHKIPIQKGELSTTGLTMRPGVITHGYASRHGSGTDHTDPGVNFPFKFVLGLAKLYKSARLGR